MTAVLPLLEVHSDFSHDWDVITATGEIDLTTTALLWNRLEESAQQSSGGLHVDLSAVTYIDSSGLSLLITTHRRLKSDGRPFSVLVMPGSQPDRVLTLGRFNSVLNLSHESTAGAG